MLETGIISEKNRRDLRTKQLHHIWAFVILTDHYLLFPILLPKGPVQSILIHFFPIRRFLMKSLNEEKINFSFLNNFIEH